MDASGAQFYKWNVDSTLSSVNISNPNASPKKTQQYYVLGTNTFGCSKWDTIQIIVNPLPSITLLSNLSSCFNVPNQIKIATTAKQIIWNYDSGLSVLNSASPMFLGKRNTTLVVNVIDDKSCRQTKSFDYIVYSLPNLELSTSNATICNGQNTNLSAKGAINYSWSGPYYIQDKLKNL